MIAICNPRYMSYSKVIIPTRRESTREHQHIFVVVGEILFAEVQPSAAIDNFLTPVDTSVQQSCGV